MLDKHDKNDRDRYFYTYNIKYCINTYILY